MLQYSIYDLSGQEVNQEQTAEETEKQLEIKMVMQHLSLESFRPEPQVHPVITSDQMFTLAPQISLKNFDVFTDLRLSFYELV